MPTTRVSRQTVCTYLGELEQASLATHLQATTLAQEEILIIQQFAASVTESLKLADADLKQRWVIETLNTEARLTVESGQKIIHAACWLGEGVFALRPSQLVV